MDRLLKQLREWLAESDPRGILEVIPFDIERVEPGLGGYRVGSPKFSLGDSPTVRVVPMCKKSLGVVTPKKGVEIRAEGRVDITDGIQKYILYRTLNDEVEQWYAIDQPLQAKPLDKEQFERFLQDLLS